MSTEQEILKVLRHNGKFMTRTTLVSHFPDVGDWVVKEALRQLKNSGQVDFRESAGGRHPTAYRIATSKGWQALTECLGLNFVPEFQGKKTVRTHRIEM